MTQLQQLTPHQLADRLLALTNQYGNLSDELARILAHKDYKWSALRNTTTSDKQADRLWYQTKDGTKERLIDFELKKLQRIMSSIKAVLQVRENEAKKLY